MKKISYKIFAVLIVSLAIGFTGIASAAGNPNINPNNKTQQTSTQNKPNNQINGQITSDTKNTKPL